jgi:oligosaccharide repeat unit polymerase
LNSVRQITGEALQFEARESSTASLLKAASGIAIVLLVLFVTVLVSRGSNIILLLGSVVVSFVSLWFMQATTRIFDFRHPTIAGVGFICYVSMCWIPSLLIFMQLTPVGYSYPIYPGPHLYTFLLATNSTLLAIPLGVWLTNKALHFRASDVKKYFEPPVVPSIDGSWAYVYFLGAALTITALYLYEVKEWPLVAMFKAPGNFAYLALLREESFFALDSHFVYVYSVLREALYPFLIALAFANYIITRKKKWLILFLLSLASGIMFASISIARGPVATILLVMTACWYLCRSGRVSSRQIVLGLTLVLAFPVLVSLLVSSLDTTIFDALKIVFIRLCYGPAYVAYVYFEVVPKEVHFQYGATIGKLAWLVGMQHADMSKQVLFTIYPDSAESGSAGGAFFADFYANFGLLGVLIGGVLMGIIMQSIQVLLAQWVRTTASMAAYAFMFYAFFMTTSRSLPTVLLSTGVVFVLISWWILIRSEERLSLRLNRAGDLSSVQRRKRPTKQRGYCDMD